MRSIVNLCADHLRTFSNQQGVKLKSSHAHELAVAFFGYKSKAAMLADTLSPIDNLAQAEFLVLTPSKFIDDRRSALEDLPLDLPGTSILNEELFTYLISEGWFSGKPFGMWKHLADILITDHFLRHGGSIWSMNFGRNEIARSKFDKSGDEYNLIPDITGSGVKLVVNKLRYAASNDTFQSIDISATIKLKRIAGHVGYSNSEISIVDNSNTSVNSEVSIW